MDIIERYIGFVYYGRSIHSLDAERINDFEYSTHGNLKLIPPSRSGLKEHVKRAAYYSGWVNYQCIENVQLPPPFDWGWIIVNGIYQPIWDPTSNSIDADLVTSTCNCTTAKCPNCKCSKSSLLCITYCNCQRNCIYNKI